MNAPFPGRNTIENQAGHYRGRANAEEVAGGSAAGGPGRFGHDFSRVQVFSRTPVRLQAQLAIGAPGDACEQEAERISAQVMRSPEPSLSPPRSVAAAGSLAAAPPGVGAALASPGQPLDATTRHFMEDRFAHDFSRVRVHSGAEAAVAARAAGARAYTVGDDLVFGAGRYAPGTPDGRRLLAHELTHVVQQSRSPAPVVQRAPDPAAPAATPPAAAPPAPAQTGLNRTLYVVHNDVWNGLPAAVRASAERELNRQFAFVGAASTEKPFSIKIVKPAQLPEQFDFSESVVTVIRGDTQDYTAAAFARQNEQIKSWLAAQHVTGPDQTLAPGGVGEHVGSAVAGRQIKNAGGTAYALNIMTGAVDMDGFTDYFFENVDSLLQKKLGAIARPLRDLSKWPAEVPNKGSDPWRPLEMLGAALGRAIAHEARHEYVGAGHADTGLGQDSPYPIGEKSSLEFSAADRKDILAHIHSLESQEGHATIVPTDPRSSRKGAEDSPF